MRISIQSERFDRRRREFNERVKTRPDFITGALGAGASIVAEQAKKNVSGIFLNSRSGRLRKSIMAGRVTRQGSTFSVWVGSKLGAGPGGVNYGAVWEFGSKMAVIRPKTTRALRWHGAGGKPVFASMVRRPAQAPRPWLQPAAEKSVSAIEDLLNRIYSDE